MRDYYLTYPSTNERIAIADLPPDRLREANVEFVNAGINGATSEAIQERIRIEMLIRSLGLGVEA